VKSSINPDNARCIRAQPGPDYTPHQAIISQACPSSLTRLSQHCIRNPSCHSCPTGGVATATGEWCKAHHHSVAARLWQSAGLQKKPRTLETLCTHALSILWVNSVSLKPVT